MSSSYFGFIFYSWFVFCIVLDMMCKILMFPAPLHFEWLSTDPPVAMFHDFLTQEEMRFMQFSIMSDMKVSTVQDTRNPEGGATKVTGERTQASGWLWDEESSLLYSMSKRVSAATGLVAHRPRLLAPGESLYYDTAEPWQVGVYSPGGHYLPHHDDFDLLDPQAHTRDGTWVGNRAATAMAYLSDVEGLFRWKMN